MTAEADVGVPETEDGSAPEGPSERSHGGTTEPPPRERSLGMFNQQVTAATTYHTIRAYASLRIFLHGHPRKALLEQGVAETDPIEAHEGYDQSRLRR